MKVTIITIGDEILIGQIVDTNSAWMANKITQAGLESDTIISIGDNADQIKKTLDECFEKTDIILMTGGLGPTKDDITKKTLCEYFGTKLIFDSTILDNIKNVISNPNALNELTESQAWVPENCTVIQNKVGTAPITWFDHNGKVLVSMPGVPYEMKYAMENEIIHRLEKKFKTESYLKKLFIVKGYPESALAIHLSEFEENLPKGFSLAYLPSLGLVKLRLFVRGKEFENELEQQAEKLRMLLGDAIISENDIPVEQLLSEHLSEKHLTIGTAESCTGGNIAHLITSISGSSRYFKVGIIAYAADEKINILQVQQSSISDYGVVSEIVATEMAKGAQRILNVDCVIATTGIAEPEKNDETGLVWICTVVGEKHITKKYSLGKYREANISRASTLAILQMIEML